MQVGDLCKRQVISIEEQATLVEAARLMRQHHVGALVVTSRDAQGRHVCGVVTDRDLVLDALAREVQDEDLRVGAIAHTTLVLVSEHADIGEAVQAMEHSGVRRLLVKGSNDQLIGILSLDDLIEAYSAELETLVRIIRSGMAREARANQLAAAPADQPLLIPSIGRATWASVVVGV
ncbi:CBS domain-containing protein [Roseateles toxinivorans]|uniref:CBS domain protein n=1 Tax=Roseateles toxinivorans TaxID=270368 RepID=A0A4R6QL86_9BURK|nr:CBS domain-containing protein [Roseateles toxinivorans]TDP64117.1 CBS domain protein [Roseateles toxinivorans]